MDNVDNVDKVDKVENVDRREMDLYAKAGLAVSTQELMDRRRRVLEMALAKGADAGVVLFDPRHVFYLSNFGFIPTERPIALVVHGDARAELVVPSLETEHAEALGFVDEVVAYFEYPTDRHPMIHLADRLGEGRYASDAPGAPGRNGYVGPSLSEVLGRDVPLLREELRLAMQVKSPQEVALVRESCRWGHLAHARLQALSRAGAGEYEISHEATLEATRAMVDTLGRDYARVSPFPVEAHAGFRGQIGANSAIPHATTIHAVLKPGDTLVTGAAGRVWGYVSELERTMFVGEPSSEQRRYFAAMLAAQDLAFATIRPGIEVAEVDREVQRLMRDAGLMPYVRHHTGHAIGSDGHESPFFDVGDHTVLAVGMVFSVEPGLYVPGLGGFRHSDTIAVTEDGCERLTLYPRNLEALVCG